MAKKRKRKETKPEQPDEGVAHGLGAINCETLAIIVERSVARGIFGQAAEGYQDDEATIAFRELARRTGGEVELGVRFVG